MWPTQFRSNALTRIALAVCAPHSLVRRWMARSELSGAQVKLGGRRMRGEGEADRLGACVDFCFRCIAAAQQI